MRGYDELMHVKVRAPEGLERMEIVDSEGCKQIVKLMKPLRYPRRVVER